MNFGRSGLAVRAPAMTSLALSSELQIVSKYEKSSQSLHKNFQAQPGAKLRIFQQQHVKSGTFVRLENFLTKSHIQQAMYKTKRLVALNT